MEKIIWPETFPNEEKMFDILLTTIQTSWHCDLLIENINQWLNNFSGEVFDKADEKLIALWLLCNFTYYNDDEISHLCRLLYKKLLHILALNECNNDEKKLKELLNHTYFSSIGEASESGGLLLYYFRQATSIPLDKCLYPPSISEKVNIAVFIDDVSLSGGTALRFYHNYLENHEYKIYFIILFATKKAIEKIENNGITVICCNLLDERDQCFSDKSIMFRNYPSLREKAEKMAKHYGNKLEKGNALGYKGGQLCFGFNYNIPNNTLPIFWSSNNWYPIFIRKEKIQNDKNRNDEFEKYI